MVLAGHRPVVEEHQTAAVRVADHQLPERDGAAPQQQRHDAPLAQDPDRTGLQHLALGDRHGHPLLLQQEHPQPGEVEGAGGGQPGHSGAADDRVPGAPVRAPVHRAAHRASPVPVPAAGADASDGSDASDASDASDGSAGAETAESADSARPWAIRKSL